MQFMSILNNTTTTKPRETDGSSTSKRFSYQHAWTLISILDAHQTDKEYIFLLEYYDDVVHWDEKYPNDAEFVQVKTSSMKTWTQSRLCKKEPNLSILDKLFDHVNKHPKCNLKLHFVSDAPFEFMTNVGKINAGDLKEDLRTKILASLGENYPELTEEDLSKLYFERSCYTQNNFDHSLTAKALDMFQEVLGEDSPNFVVIWLKAWKDEVIRKSNDDSRVNNNEELLQKKSIRRIDVENSLQTVKKNIEYKNNAWPFFSKYLTQEGIHPIKLLKLQKAWDESIIKSMNSADELNQTLSSCVIDALNNYSNTNCFTTFTALVDELLLIIKSDLDLNPFSDGYIQAVVLREWYEQNS